LQFHHINEESNSLTYRAGWCNSIVSGCLDDMLSTLLRFSVAFFVTSRQMPRYCHDITHLLPKPYLLTIKYLLASFAATSATETQSSKHLESSS